jgi:excinuclease ABC subunit B
MSGTFKLTTPYRPGGDQPQAIERLAAGLEQGYRYQTLLGITGSGKTLTMAHVISRWQRPALVIAPNKTLALQLRDELCQFFPENAVEYFVSYYDYYQPEAYIPQTDTYIEKEGAINDEIDRRRHAATQAVRERQDVIIVASVSCIYGLGSPEEYDRTTLPLIRGQAYGRRELLGRLVDMRFTRNDLAPTRGMFRVKGDLLEIYPADEESLIRIDFFGDEIDRILRVDPTTGEIAQNLDCFRVFPATHFVATEDTLESAIRTIELELEDRLDWFRARDRHLEAQRLEERTHYDIEMMRETGYCYGIENYSRHLDGRAPGMPPQTLLDYFPKEFLLLIDESHQTLPQLRGMFAGDMARKQPLVEGGYRLPSARDNRPLRWEEFDAKICQAICVSATPGPYEHEVSAQTVEQIIRPTGLVDPEIEIRPSEGQIDDLLAEIHQRISADERVLVTTLTKEEAEKLSDHLASSKAKVQYLHADIKTLERWEILHDLRRGVYDVVVGINLLREGLDLPEVSLVAILNADAEGFLRSETALIQTVGRAARNVHGKVLMYADTLTGSMQRAIDETNRRRALQLAYNQEHGITPETVRKNVPAATPERCQAQARAVYPAGTPIGDPEEAIAALETEMKRTSRALDFERAIALRDEIARLRRLLSGPKI